MRKIGTTYLRMNWSRVLRSLASNGAVTITWAGSLRASRESVHIVEISSWTEDTVPNGWSRQSSTEVRDDYARILESVSKGRPPAILAVNGYPVAVIQAGRPLEEKDK